MNDRFKNLVIDIKEYLMYKIKYIESKTYDNLSWQLFINAIENADLIVDYYHKYSEREKSHSSFKKSFEWIPLLTFLIYNYCTRDDLEFELKYWVKTTEDVTLFSFKYTL